MDVAVVEKVDTSIEPETRRISSEMGEPTINEVDWDVFFGRCNGKLSPEILNKLVYAHAVAQSIERKEP